VSNGTASNRTRKVWVLWDDENDRRRGKTHALDCHIIDSFHWAKGAYRKVDVTDIPDHVGRCGFCGGGRPRSKGRDVRPTFEDVDVLGQVDAVQLGRRFRVHDEQSSELRTWTIVSPGEADVAHGKISSASETGKTFLGKSAGPVTVQTPRGPRPYTILELL
jgi:hypothetical protein